MPTTTPTRRSRYAPPFVTKNDLLELLNADFDRECRAIYAHAVYAERLRDRDPARAGAITRGGQQAVLAALALCQLVYDYGGSAVGAVDELNAVLNADRVATPEWALETERRLQARVTQLRAAGEPGLAKRVRRLLLAKRARPSLVELAGGG
ncbi:MAG: hypothetical protein K2V38_04130 [Gemmataceae bacterium]|nr:hypothetical protein [Gemmataceae bacterium]